MEYEIRYADGAAEVALQQVAGDGRLLVKSGSRTWWQSPPAVVWGVHEVSDGIFASANEAASAADRLTNLGFQYLQKLFPETSVKDEGLVTLDAPELRKAIAEALTELRQIETRVSELLGPLEARIAALEERLAKLS